MPPKLSARKQAKIYLFMIEPSNLSEILDMQLYGGLEEKQREKRCCTEM